MSRDPQYKDALAEVDRLLRAGDNDEALAAVERLLEAHPDDPRVRRRQGFARIGRGEVDEGIRILRKVTEDKPEDAVSAYELGRGLVGAGRAGEAEAVLADLVGRVQGFTPAWFVLGDALVELGRNDDAVEAYRQGMANDPFRRQLDESKGAMRAHEHQKARRLLTGDRRPGCRACRGTRGTRGACDDRRRLDRSGTHHARDPKAHAVLAHDAAGLVAKLYLMTSRFVEAAETLATLTAIEGFLSEIYPL